MMNREDDKPTKLTSGRLSKSMRASAITDQRFKALQTSAIEVMVLSSGRLIARSAEDIKISGDLFSPGGGDWQIRWAQICG